MTNLNLHVTQNQFLLLPIKTGTLTHSNDMQIELIIIENLEVALQDSKSNISSTIKLPISSNNAKDSNLSEKALPPDTATENKPLTGHGKYTTTTKSNSKPTKDPYPTPTTIKSPTHIMGGNGSGGTCHLFQHHVGRQENCDCATKYSLSDPTNFGGCSSSDEQLYESSLDKQCTSTNCSEYVCQSHSSNEGGMESSTSFCPNLEHISNNGVTILHHRSG